MHLGLRRSAWVAPAAVLLFVACAVVPACDESDSTSTLGDVDGSIGNPGDDASTADGAVDAATNLAALRIANLSPDVGRVDVCYRTSSTEAFTGPLVLGVPSDTDSGTGNANDGGADSGADGDAGDAGDSGSTPPHEPPGVSFPGATRYFAVPPSGSLEVAVVRALDGNCATPRVRQLIPLDPGNRVTVALIGLSQADAGTTQELALVPFADDPSPTVGTTRTRFIHGALGTPKGRAATALAVEATVQNTIIPLAGRVEPGRTATPSNAAPIVDVRGYHDGEPIGSGAIHVAEIGDAGVADAAPASWISAVMPLDLRQGATHTGFIVSTGAKELGLLLCDDGAPDGACVVLHP